MKRIVVTALLFIAVGVVVRAYYATKEGGAPTITTARVSQGAVANRVSATGTIQAVTTVQVGTQVSGTINWLGADYNSIVRKGQVIARLDASLLQAQVAQAEANVAQARAQVDNSRVQVTDAQQKFGRAQELAARQLIARSELDAATVAVDTARAQQRSAEAGLVQAEASLNQNRVNLEHTTITAPIDGIVIERSVDVGQTVAASLQSPTIFAIAADLAQMRVSASVDESDIGNIRPRQPVSFGVDAYAGETFNGIVSQIRLQPAVVQNVTTYSVVIDVPNPQLKLKPGMTANVAIEIASRDEAVLVPNAALRFRPTAEMFIALDQPAPPLAARAPRQPDGGSRNRTAEKKADAAAPVTATGRSSSATSVDALFAPLSPSDSEGTVWLLKDGRLESMAVRVGISDGHTSELLNGSLTPGTALVINVATQAAPTRSVAAPGGLFMPPGGPDPGQNRTAGSNGRQSAAGSRR